jgi:hypothetical protein
MFRVSLSRAQFVVLFVMVIAVIDVGHLQSPYAYPGPSGFTRIARDLGRRFGNGESANFVRGWAFGPAEH